MQRRAEQQDQTRERITESAVELHGTLGPSRTSISAIADHAGVRRSTVYRHFPDEATLFDACSAHWAARNPVPDLGAWAAVEDPDERLCVALAELHAYYRLTEGMLDNLIRDEAVMPAVAERFAGFRHYIGAAVETLMDGRRLPPAAARLTRAALAHALAFTTWKSLVREHGVTDADAVTLLCGLVGAAAATPSSSGRRTRAASQASGRAGG